MRNLLPYSEKETIDRLRTARMLTVALISLILLAALLCLLLTPTFLTINSRHTLWQGEIQRLEDSGVAVSAAALEAHALRAKTLKNEFAGPESYSPISAIVVARSVVPAGITLSGFAFTAGVDRTLTIQGVVTTRDVLQAYADALEKHPTVAMVDNPVTNYLKQRDNEFTLTVTFK
ncbi:MAG TPA: hypothetical protein VGE18_03555 [Candidatus Paceibacterota bacterium]